MSKVSVNIMKLGTPFYKQKFLVPPRTSLPPPVTSRCIDFRERASNGRPPLYLRARCTSYSHRRYEILGFGRARCARPPHPELRRIAPRPPESRSHQL